MHLKLKLITFLFCFSIPLFSQEFLFQSLTVANGLPSNLIRCLFQDSRGFLWIGTTEGVSVFDGTTFTLYNHSNGLSNDNVNHISESLLHKGVMYISTNGGGICKFVEGKFETLSINYNRYSNFVNCTIEDKTGALWCATDGGVFRLFNDSVYRCNPIPSNNDSSEVSLNVVQVNDSTIAYCVHSSIYFYSLNTHRFTRLYEPVQKGSAILHLSVDDEKTLWASTSDSIIYKIENEKISEKRHLPYGIANHVLHTQNGMLWISSTNSLITIQKKSFGSAQFIRYDKKNGVRAKWLWQPLEDNEHILWFATADGGLLKLAQSNIVHFNDDIQPLMDNNANVAADSNGHLWVSVGKELWEIWKGTDGLWKKYVQRQLSSSTLHWCSVSYDTRHTLWATLSDNTIERFSITCNPDHHSDLHRIAEISSLQKYKSDSLLCFTEDSNGSLWAAVHGHGVVVLSEDRRQWRIEKFFNDHNGLPHYSIRSFCVDSKNNVWVGGYMLGFSKFTSSRLNDAPQRGLVNWYIRSMFGSRIDGSVWIGSRYDGCARILNNDTTYFSTSNGLASNSIHSIAEDANGIVWLGTDAALQYYDPKTKSLNTFSEVKGNTIFSLGFTKDNVMWVVTREGLTLCENPITNTVIQSSPIYINKFLVNTEEQQIRSGAEFPYSKNNCEFHIVGINFRDPVSLRYQYRLIGFDSAWTPWTQNKTVAYASLQPGRYTFEARSRNGSGIINAQTASLSFTILKPFWKETWFIGLSSMIILSLVTFAYNYRVRQLLKLERMRTRIASDLHDDIGASLSRIALFSEVAKEEAATSSPKLSEMAEKIGNNARELLDAVSTLVWTIDPRHDRFNDVLTQMKNFAMEMFTAKEIDYSFLIDEPLEDISLPIDIRKNLLLIFKEAVNNVARHSGCQSIAITLSLQTAHLVMIIADDGKGIPSKEENVGHGLMNMKMRAKSMNGTAEFLTNGEHGTIVHVQIPLP